MSTATLAEGAPIMPPDLIEPDQGVLVGLRARTLWALAIERQVEADQAHSLVCTMPDGELRLYDVDSAAVWEATGQACVVRTLFGVDEQLTPI